MSDTQLIDPRILAQIFRVESAAQIHGMLGTSHAAECVKKEREKLINMIAEATKQNG